MTDFGTTDMLDLSDLVTTHSASIAFSAYDSSTNAITVTATAGTNIQLIEVVFDASVANHNLIVEGTGVVKIG